jgi:hypothetical protein
MGIKEIILLLNNRLTYMAQQRDQAVARGDITALTAIDADIAQTSSTLSALQTL